MTVNKKTTKEKDINMPTETKVTSPTLTIPTTVERNGVVEQLVAKVFGKKSPSKGQTFYAPEFTEATFENDVKWFGLGDLIAWINKSLRTEFASIWTDCIDETTGILDQQKLSKAWAEFTEGVEKLSDIDEQLEGLYDQQQAVVNDDNFGAETKVQAADGTVQDVKTPEAQKLEDLMRELTAKIRPLKAAKARISAEYQVRADKRKAAKAAKDAADAAAKASREAGQPVAA